MTNQKFSIKCPRCLGTGSDSNVTPPILCDACSGTGYIDSALIDTTEITNELNWLKKKIKKILQKLEISEE